MRPSPGADWDPVVAVKFPPCYLMSPLKRAQSYIYILSAAVVLGLMIFLFARKGINLDEILFTIGEFSWTSIVLAFSAISFQLLMQICRLWILLPPQCPIGWFRVAQSFMYGQVINCFAPARAGDAAKVVLMSKGVQDKFPMANAAGVMVADKATDLASLLTWCLLLGAPWLKLLPGLPSPSAKIGEIVLIVMGTIALILCWRRRDWWPKVVAALSQFMKGLGALKDPRRALGSFGYGLGNWTFEMIAVWALCHGQNHALSFSNVLWVIVVLNLGIAIPISVANLGTFEASMVLGLAQFGVPTVTGLAIGTVHHALQILAIGGWAFVLWGIGFRRNPSLKALPSSPRAAES
jgi:uncharacterized membrane protein YbhN (UPF0104 family)